MLDSASAAPHTFSVSALRLALLVLMTALPLLSACGDPAREVDFAEAYTVQGFLVVGDPIRDILVARTGTIADTFKLATRLVSDAQVQITLGSSTGTVSRTFALRYNAARGSYEVPDSTVRVLADTVYSLRVETRSVSGGGTAVFTGQTRTPQQIRWIREPRRVLQYPKNDMEIQVTSDTLLVAWSPVRGVQDYLVGIRCNDTSGYGVHFPRFLNRAADTSQKTRRIERFFESQDPRYAEIIRYALRAQTASPLIWTGFKWFGYNEIIVFAADPNWLNWYRMRNLAGNPRYNPLLGSIKSETGDDVYGAFGSASEVRKEVFVLKTVQ
jgi:hypothetical protein